MLINQLSGPAVVFLLVLPTFLSSIIQLEKVLIIGDFNLHIDEVSYYASVEFLTITDTFNLKQHVSGDMHLKVNNLKHTANVIKNYLQCKEEHDMTPTEP